MRAQPKFIDNTFSPSGLGGLSNSVALPSPGVSPDADRMDETLKRMFVVPPSALVGQGIERTLSQEALFEARLKAKLLVANVAMHIRSEWRLSLFKQLDDLLDFEEWDPDDPLPRAGSVRTFLRTIIYHRFTKCPGLGISQGNLIGTWTTGRDRLTIECLDSDTLQWVSSRYIDDFLELASGVTKVTRLQEVLRPYFGNPSSIFHVENQSPR